MHTNLSVGLYYGDMGVDFWDGEVWKQEIDKHEVLSLLIWVLFIFFLLNVKFWHGTATLFPNVFSTS